MCRARRVDEKNRFIRLVMFTSIVIVIRISKVAHFMYLLLHAEKKSFIVWGRYLNASKRSYLVLLQNTLDYGVLSYH